MLTASAARCVRPAIEALPRSKISDAYEYGVGRPGLIPLWFGESDEPSPAFIGEAASRALQQGLTYYAPKRGLPDLRDALARYSSRLYGQPIDIDRISVLPSGMAAIMLTIQALVEPGRNVVMITPFWPNGGAAVKALGGELREVALDQRADGGWSLDLDKLFAAVDDRTVMLFLNSPNNPTGWTASRAELQAILDRARTLGLWVLSDEVYGRIAYAQPGQPAPSMLELITPEDRVVVANSFSKSWAMTGWRLGWVTIPQEIVGALEKLNEINATGAATFVQAAGITAVEQGEGFVAEQLARFATNRRLVQEKLGQLPNVRIAAPDGAFYGFFAVEGETDSVALVRRLIDKANVGLAPGLAFGQAGEGFLRLCFAAATPTLTTALDRLVAELRG